MVYVALQVLLCQAFNPEFPFSSLIQDIETEIQKKNFELYAHELVQFGVKLKIQKDNITTTYIIYRNGKMKLTRLVPEVKSVHSEQLEQILQPFINTSLVEK